LTYRRVFVQGKIMLGGFDRGVRPGGFSRGFMFYLLGK